MKRTLIWLGALVLGGVLGTLGIEWLNDLFDFIALVYTRLFQFLSVPTIALAVITTLSILGTQTNAGKIFAHTITYTLITTFIAAGVGLALYLIMDPENLPQSLIATGTAAVDPDLEQLSYYDHIIKVIPNNIILPFTEGNVLSVLLIAAAIGLALAYMPKTEQVKQLLNVINGLQDLLFTLIRGLIWALPLGIIAFAGQLTEQITAGTIVGSLGKYVTIILGGNLIQFFIVLPLFLLIMGINPIKVLRGMLPAVMMALFSKSSAATLPVTLNSHEENLGTRREVSRFVLPICTTINMNGCAAFILVTSLFVLQHSQSFDAVQLFTWVCIAVISAVGNAGVPMGCYFLTLSLIANAPGGVGIMGIILPIYTIIDMIETAENVWSDSCVCAVVNKVTAPKDGAETAPATEPASTTAE